MQAPSFGWLPLHENVTACLAPCDVEDADSDSGFDSDGNWYHAGRDELYGLRTNSNAVGPDGAHRRRFLCGEEKKGGTRWGCLSFVVKDIVSQRVLPHTSAISPQPSALIHLPSSIRLQPSYVTHFCPDGISNGIKKSMIRALFIPLY